MLEVVCSPNLEQSDISADMDRCKGVRRYETLCDTASKCNETLLFTLIYLKRSHDSHLYDLNLVIVWSTCIWLQTWLPGTKSTLVAISMEFLNCLPECGLIAQDVEVTGWLKVKNV